MKRFTHAFACMKRGLLRSARNDDEMARNDDERAHNDKGITTDMKRFTQSCFWAEFKSRHGWKNCPVTVDGTNYSVLILHLNLRFKKISIAYIPMAPECDSTLSPKELAEGLSKLALALKPELPANTFCIRFDPAMDFEETSNRDEYVQKFRQTNGSFSVKKALTDVQPPDTTVLSLIDGKTNKRSDDDLLAAMKSKWRYNIKLAAKKSVAVEKYDFATDGFDKAFEEFYTLFQQTSQRDGVQFHNKSYYQDLFELASKSQYAKDEKVTITLYLAKHEDDYLAGIITLFCPGEAVYLYGASGNIKRNLMPAYLLQWTAIQDAREYGCPAYDFYGMPPTDDENHPMHGLYLFKTGFGGKIIHRPGSFDAIIKKGDYTLYAVAEKMRAFYYKVIVKKLHGR